MQDDSKEIKKDDSGKKESLKKEKKLQKQDGNSTSGAAGIVSKAVELEGKVKEFINKRSLFHKIVNVFLYFFLTLFVIVMLVLGITQTSFFREYLRETIIEEVNSSLNGKIYIEKLDGTLLSSIILRNVNVTMKEDTLFKSELVEVRISPLQIFLKKIYARKVLIRNADIKFIEGPDGILNIAKLVPPSEDNDTTKSELGLAIEAADVQLENINFAMKNYQLVNDNSYYDNLNMSNFVVKNFNLSLYAFADIDNNDYKVGIRNITAEPNINNFKLNKFKAGIHVSPKEIDIKELAVETENSKLDIKLNLQNFNLFDSTSSLTNGYMKLDVKADKFDFADVTPFVPAMEILKGALTTTISAEGSFKELNINTLDITYNSTHLSTSAKLYNIDAGADMYITTKFKEGKIHQSDIASLLPTISIPQYKEYGDIKIDTLIFEGNPLKFKTIFSATTSMGSLGADFKLDLDKPELVYSGKFKTSGLNIAPIASMNTGLNLNGTFEGVGTNPATLNAKFSVTGDNSTIGPNKFASLKFDAATDNNLIEYTLIGRKDSTKLDVTGTLNFANENMPEYTVKGDIKNLNVFDFTQDSSMINDLNMSFDIDGAGFNPDKMELAATLDVFNSTIYGSLIENIKASLDLGSNEGGERVVALHSDLADLTLNGNFTFAQVADILSKESGVLQTAINNKIREILPEIKDSVTINSNALVANDYLKKTPEKPAGVANIKYLLIFKNMSPVSAFLSGSSIDIKGEVSGEMISRDGSFSLVNKGKLNQVKYWNNDQIVYVTGLVFDFNIENNTNEESFESISAYLNAGAKRVFAGSDLRDLRLSVTLKKDSSFVNAAAKIDKNIDAKIAGKFAFAGNTINLNLDTLNLKYYDFIVKNRGIAGVSYSKDKIEISNFNFGNEAGEIQVDGYLAPYIEQKLNLRLVNFDGSIIGKKILELAPENNMYSRINMNTVVTGNMYEPVIKSSISMDSITYRGKNYGNFNSKFAYIAKKLAVDVRFIDSLGLYENPTLLLTGTLPIDLTILGNVTERIDKTKNIEFALNASDFNIATFGDLMPQVNNLKGLMTADIKLSGPVDNMVPAGYLYLKDGGLIAEANNMEYRFNLDAELLNNKITLKNCTVENAPNTQGGGRITFTGDAGLAGFTLQEMLITAEGDLKVLSEASKNSKFGAYGDLVLGTDRKIEFTYGASGMFLRAPIVIKTAKVNIPPTESSYKNTNSTFRYRIKEDTNIAGNEISDFDKMIEENKKKKTNNAEEKKYEVPFDYDVKLRIQNEAVVGFVLNKELNQALTAIMKGEIDYSFIKGKTNAQGEFTLLEGSTLEFIKTFAATGSIRFESEITNPYLNITATYKDYYSPPDSSKSSEIEAAVKIKVVGPLKELDKNFLKLENNIAVYYGAENINNDVVDATKDASDALMFIVTGKFKDDLSQSERTAATTQLSSTATSLAGSVIGGVLNRYLGDYVRSVELRQVGTATKFNLSGRVNKFRYTIGGSTTMFQDLSQANVRIEYPIIENLLLRLERKEDVTKQGTINEMINELGLKYRFEF